MKYFLLQNRRHLGPYTLEQLAQMVSKQSVPRQAYVLSEENSGLGKLNYQKLSDVLKGTTELSSDLQREALKEAPKEKAQFPEEEIENMEKTFLNAVDPLDLVKTPHTNASSAAPQLPPPPRPSSLKGFLQRLQFKFRTLPTPVLLGFVVLLGLLFLAQGVRLSKKNQSSSNASSVSRQTAGEASPPSNKSGAPLSGSLNLGPAVPRPTIQIPRSQRAPTAVTEDEVIDVEGNLDQGESPEPSLIKKKPKKKKRPIEENPDEESGIDGDRNPDSEEFANEEDYGGEEAPPEEEMESEAPMD